MIYAFDIDNTICETQWADYQNSKPKFDVIAKVNKCYEQGDTVIIYTARGTQTGLNWKPLTITQLEKWGVKYHQLLFGKPAFTRYIGDEATNIRDWMKEC